MSVREESINHQLSRELVQALIKEQRANRRWRNFRFLVMLLFSIGVTLMLKYPNGPFDTHTKYVALVRMHGTIDADGPFSAENMVPVLQDAFSDKKSLGVVLVINSGGGTPVQAAIIHDAILYYKNKYHKKVIAVGEDFLASGAYYIAVAADKIYVNPNTLAGSVGAIMKSFGFTELLKKLGIERRIYKSGSAKNRFDPFSPQDDNDAAKAQEVLQTVQHNFAQVVLAARAKTIHGDYSKLFNGDFWSGSDARQLGLVDELGNLLDALNQEFATTKYYDYSNTTSLLDRVKDILGVNINTWLNKLG